MLTIRNEQLRALGAPQQDAFLNQMAAHLRSFFPERADGLEDRSLKHKVAEALAGASALGLSGRRDLCRYLNLVGLYGWHFEKSEAFAGMRARLEDPAISSPSERLENVWSRCLQQQETERNNRDLRRSLGIDEAHRI